MKGPGGRLLGDAGRFPFEQRIFHLAMLTGIGLMLFGTVMDIFYRAPILFDLIFLGCWLLAYFLSRVKNLFQVTSVVSIGVLVFIFIPYNWLANGGLSGVLPFYTILFIAVISLILKGPLRLAMVCSMLAIELLLVAHDAILAGSFLAVVRSNLRPLDFAVHLFVILAATAALMAVYSNTYLREKERGEAYARAIEEHYRRQIYYMENLEKLIYKLKSERHDFNNHLGAVYGLLEGGEAEKARQYAAQLIKTAEEYRNIVNVPYPVVRAMLNYKLSAAREGGIELRLDVDIPPGLPLDEFDATVILGNLLDNAAEACADVEPGGRFIGLSIRYKPDYLVIRTENPAEPGAEGGPGRSTKPGAEERGFGLSNIQYLAARHNGFLKTAREDGVFVVNVALLVRARE